MSVDLSLGAVDGTSQTIDNTGGSGVTLPSATTSTAGLMSATDKAEVDNSIQQNGNIFGTAINVRTNDAYAVNIKTDGSNKVGIDINGNVGVGVSSPTTFNASAPLFPSLAPKMEVLTGTSLSTAYTEAVVIRHTGNDSNAVSRNAGLIFKLSNEVDANESAKAAAVTLSSANSNADNPDMNFYIGNKATPVFQLLNNGNALFPKGTTAGGTRNIVRVSENGGYIDIGNGTTTGTASMNPVITGLQNGSSDSAWGIQLRGAIDNNTQANVVIRAVKASGSAVTSGNIFSIQNTNATGTKLSIDYAGVTTINNLAGTGTRMVTADSTGALSAATEVTSGTYTPTVLASTGGTFTVYDFTYTKINNIITVNGRIDCNLTATGQNDMVIDLPYPITVTNVGDINGTVSGSNVSGATTSNEGAYITAYFGLNGASIKFFAVDNLTGVFATFSYKV